MDKSIRFYLPAVGARVPSRKNAVILRRRRFKDQRGFRNSARKFLDEFLRSSSIHGLSHLATGNKHLSEYILWMLALLAAITGMSFMALNAWNRYQYYPTVLSMEKDYKNWNTSFASATICPYNRIDADILRKVGEKRGVKDIEGFIGFFKKLSTASYMNMDELPDYNEVDPRHYIRILEEAKFNFTFILSNSKDVQQVPLLTVNEYGLCYFINTDLGIYFTPRNLNRKLPVKRGNSNLLYGNPLDMEVSIQIMNINSGYNVSITGPYEVSDMSVKKSSVEELRYLVLELTTLPILSSQGLRRLSTAQRKCRFFDESNLEVSDVYSYNLCRMQCRARLALKLCECVPYFYKNPKGRPYCDAVGMKCLGKHGSHLFFLRDPKTNEKIHCDCLPLCNDYHYLIDQELLMLWPSYTHMKIAVFNFPRTRLRREVIFGFDDFLVSVGGTAGLLLGCSFLSFIEIVYFFTLRLYFFLQANNRTKRMQKRN